MAALFEPHQVEKRYGGTAPDLAPEKTYPYKFFPNCTGQGSSSASADKSLHMFTDRAFHEGFLWDESSEGAKGQWFDKAQEQSLTSAAVAALESMGAQNAKAC